MPTQRKGVEHYFKNYPSRGIMGFGPQFLFFHIHISTLLSHVFIVIASGGICIGVHHFILTFLFSSL